MLEPVTKLFTRSNNPFTSGVKYAKVLVLSKPKARAQYGNSYSWSSSYCNLKVAISEISTRRFCQHGRQIAEEKLGRHRCM